MDVEEFRRVPPFTGLADDHVDLLWHRCTVVDHQRGDALWTEGQPADFWWVLVDGTIELCRQIGVERLVLGALDAPGRWAGGFRAWDDAGVYLASGLSAGDGRVLRIDSPALAEVLTAIPLEDHLVQGLWRTMRRIEAGARHRDALVTLGTLSAGLAHELNNPAAAASRALGSLDDEIGTLVASLHRLVHESIAADALVALDDLRAEIDRDSAPLDPLALADREDRLALWLTRHQVDRSWILAPALAVRDVDTPWLDRLAVTVPASALAAALDWVVSLTAVSSLLAEAKESTRRVSELVGSIKTYTQMDRAEVQSIDVCDGIESTLVVLARKLRDGITVERDYAPDLRHIEAYAGELNQVWTNLIDNALDAMDGVGVLRISTRATSIGGVVVEIGDSGVGMSTDVAGRAFEAFYTTKEVGRGTGLGLDIARRIVVDRHGGTIEIQSVPGDTVLRVTLPPHPAGR